MSTNILTAIRVRPFSKKEITNKTTNVVQMDGNTTKINFQDKSHSFAFDNCFWSHDGFVNDSNGYSKPVNPKYTDQKQLYEKLGKPLLDNAWEGYNCSLFAYGQTGSGKTYSMMGYETNKGLIPMICDNLFDQISKKAPTLKEGEKYQVTMGMLEIYNEKVRDLLAPNNNENLSVKEDPIRGFFAPNQLMVPVSSFDNIQQKMALGTKQRTIAATNMNETSSRAHTIVSLQFVQICTTTNKKMTRKTSFINLIDLAGSEQVKKSGAEGARLMEAQNINKSLHTLGLCLYNLSTKQSHVPYRDSILTKLLMNALGGNSKTALLAAISPADSNFDESVSTLKFAQRVKLVSTKAKVNVTENDVAIKKLAEENLKLQQMLKELQDKKVTKDDSKLIEELQNQILRNKEEADANMLSWKEQAQKAKDELEKQRKSDEERKEKLKSVPHMFNLNEDPALNKLLVYVFDKPVTVIGNSKALKSSPIQDNVDIDLQGINILGRHAEIRQDTTEKKTFIKPLDNADLFINGTKITKEYELKHYDRILLGNSLYFFHYDPLDTSEGAAKIPEPTIDVAREEIMKKIDEFKDVDNKILHQQLSTVYPLVQEANSLAKQMDKRVVYSLVIFNGNLPGYNSTSEPQVMIRLLLTTKKWEYFLDVNEFTDIRFAMIDMYQDFMNGSTADAIKSTFDPFIPKESDLCCVGYTHVLLKPIKYLLDFSDALPIMNYQAKEVGRIKFSFIPCDSGWKPCDFSETEIGIGTKLFLRLFAEEISFEKTMFKKVYYRLKFYDQIVKSPMSNVVKDIAKFSFEYKVDGMIFTDSINKYFDEMVGVEIWGCYGDSDQSDLPKKSDASGATSKKKHQPNNVLDANNAEMQKFLTEFQKMTEQRIKEGHKTIEIADLQKIVPENIAKSSKVCVIQ